MDNYSLHSKLVMSAINSTDTDYLSESLDATVADFLLLTPTVFNVSNTIGIATITHHLVTTGNWIYLSHTVVTELILLTDNAELCSKGIYLGGEYFYMGLLNPDYNGDLSVIRRVLANPKYSHIHKYLLPYLNKEHHE